MPGNLPVLYQMPGLFIHVFLNYLASFYFTSGKLSPLTLTDESGFLREELVSYGFSMDESGAGLLFCMVESSIGPGEGPLESILPPGLLSQAIRAKPIIRATHIFFI